MILERLSWWAGEMLRPNKYGLQLEFSVGALNLAAVEKIENPLSDLATQASLRCFSVR